MGAVDARQIVAGFLTVTMFVMLANMIKRDHFDSSIQMKLPGMTETQLDNSKVAEQSVVKLHGGENGPWMENEEELKPCWTMPPLENAKQSSGFVIFSLTNGPEYHVSQIANAVVVARYLGATLVLPDIRGSKPGDIRKFEDIYDADKFVRSLDGVVVQVAKHQPAEISLKNLAVVRVPNRVSKDHIEEHIEPVFKRKGNIRLATYFHSVNMRTEQKSSDDSVACLGMFRTLELQSEINEVVDSMVERLRTSSHKSDGKFIAVDLRVGILESKGCQGGETAQMKSCYSAHEVALFLRKTGFDKDTAIYLTQSRWDSSLSDLKDLFPKVYTKESLIPADKAGKILNSESPEFEEVIDFYICSQSDVFVPAISGLFYANVAGKRIASGKTQILVPAEIPTSSAPAHDFISHYVSKKNHFAYSCFY